MILTNKCTVISSKKKDVLNHKCRSMSNCGTKKTPVFSNFLLLEGTIYGRGGDYTGFYSTVYVSLVSVGGKLL